MYKFKKTLDTSSVEEDCIENLSIIGVEYGTKSFDRQNSLFQKLPYTLEPS